MRFALYPIIVLALAAGCMLPISAAEPEPGQPREIPLKDVWALGMPGTLDVRKLAAGTEQEKAIESIRGALAEIPKAERSRRGFALAVTDHGKLLEEVRDILATGREPIARFTTDDDISLVFFSYQFPQYVHVHSIERQDDAIRISYRFVPHESAETTAHFAVIPAGKLPAGNYMVRVEPLPMEKKFSDLGFSPPPESAALRVVCRTFYFVVTD